MKKGKIKSALFLRIILIITCVFGVGWFVLPILTGRILNLGNATGIIISLLMLFCCIFATNVNALVRKIWKNKSGKIMLGICACMAGAVILLVGIETGCMIYAASKSPAETATLVVLGCRTYGDRPSVMLATRLDAAYDYLVEHPQALCVVSGGQGSDEPVSEGEFMYGYLVEKGIEAERIYRETESTSTRENLLFSKAIMEEEGLNPEIAIVTNEYHEYRAFMVADALGMECSAVPAQTPWWLFPTYYIRELYGIIYEWAL